MNRRAPLLALLATLPACSLFGPADIDIQIQEKVVPVICDTSARPDGLNLKDTPPTLVMNDAEIWGYWFGSELYAALAENLQSMRTWMTQSNAIRNKLIQCIDDHNDAAQADSSEPSEP